MRNRGLWIILAAVILFAAGCGTVKQLWSDNQAGRQQATPEEKQLVTQTAQQNVDFLKNIPVVGTYAGILLPVFAFFGFAHLGAQKRKGQSISDKPFTGYLGSLPVGLGPLKISFEQIIQWLANFNSGVVEWGADGSPLKRGWKTVVHYVFGLVLAALTIPGVKEWLWSNPATATGIGVLTSGSAMLSKFLDSVKPVQQVIATADAPAAAVASTA